MCLKFEVLSLSFLLVVAKFKRNKYIYIYRRMKHVINMMSHDQINF